MKNSWHCSTLRSLSTCHAARLTPFKIALVLMLAVASAAAPAGAQAAHFAGAELPVYTGDAQGIAMDLSGNLYIADETDTKVLKETPTPSGWVQTVVDTNFGRVQAVAVDKNGVVYVADATGSRVVKEIPFGSIYVQQNVAINLLFPQAVAVDSNLNVYIAYNGSGIGNTGGVIKETPSGSGYIQHTVVGTGLNGPYGVAADNSGNVFIAESGANRVLEESPSGSTYTQTVVSNALNGPSGLTLDGFGNLYVADLFNNRIVKETYFFGWTQTVVPTDTLYWPTQVAFDPAGNLYIADDYNGAGRVIEFAYSGGPFAPQALGPQNFPHYMYLLFAFDSPGTLGTVGFKVMTEGTLTGDFADTGIGTCKGGTYYAAGATCWAVVNFTAESPGMRKGAVELVGSQGQTIATGYIYGVGQGPQTAFTPGTITFVPYSGNGSISPYGVAVDRNGDVFINDSTNNRILKESWTGSGFTESVIGSGLNSPGGIALDGAGNLYIADSGNNQILRETYSNGSYVQAVIANGLNSPQGVAVDVSGNVYIADTLNNRILKKWWQTGVVSTLPIPSLNHPFGVAVDGQGRVLVADTVNNRGLSVVQNPDGTITETILDSNLNKPYGVAADAMGNAYFANFGDGTVTKEIANSDGSYTYSLLPTVALANPYGLAIDGKGNVYVADVGDMQVLVQDYSDPPQLSFANTAPGATSSDSPKTVTVENIGNAALSIVGMTYPTDFPEAGNVATDCTASTDLQADATCTLSIKFVPQASSPNSNGAMNESVTLTDNNLLGTNVAQSVSVSGTMVIAPNITFPGPGAALTGSSVTFTWTAGNAATMFQLLLGTTQGGHDVYNGSQTTATSLPVTGIPTNGVTLYARLMYQVGSSWLYRDYNYKEFGPPVKAVLTTPAPGSTLAGTSATFKWTAGTLVTKYDLYLGTTGLGSKNVYDGPSTTALSSPVISNIPAFGVTLYARLFSYINGAWQYTDYTYKESGTPVKAAMSSPTAGTTLGTSATFTWTAGSGVTQYELHLGTAGAGSTDVYNGASTTLLTSGTINNIPAYGVPLYARLYSYINGAWQYNDYAYTESGTPVKATMSSPTAGTTLGTSATFTWSAGGGVTKYELHLGTAGAGSADVYNGANTTALTSGVVSIPAYGVTLYARLYSYINGAWQYNDYSYKESGTPVKAVLKTPTPGSTLTGSSATFTWTAGGGVTKYDLYLGTTGPGSKDVYAGPSTTALSSGTVNNIPVSGATLYARLFSYINGAWQYTDYTYKEF